MMKDYEAIALAKAEAKGPKEVAHYKKKLAKDIKQATKGSKVYNIVWKSETITYLVRNYNTSFEDLGMSTVNLSI